MKKLALLLVLPLLLGLIVRSEFPVTVAWDAGAGATSYEVVIAKTDHTGIISLGTTTGLEYTIQLAAMPYGTWVVGVRSRAQDLVSEYVWSEESVDPFVLQRVPGAPSNIRLK